MASIRFGVAVRDTTPPYPVMLHGYGARDRLSGIRGEDRVDEPISVRALCLEGRDSGGGRKRLLVITVDMIGLHGTEVAELRAAIERETGLEEAEVLIAASHTHFAPSVSTQLFLAPELGVVEPDPRYVAAVRCAVLQAAAESVSEQEEATFESYRVEVPSVLFNRRTMLRSSGAARTVQTNFRTRPMGPESVKSADAENQLVDTQPDVDRATLVQFFAQPFERLLLVL